MSKNKKEKPEHTTIAELVGFIVKDQGDGACRVGTKVDQCESIPTGSLTLDIALGVGGIPRGRITEIYGPEASGKTTLTLEIAANVQRAGGTVAFIDVEHALDPVYADALGVDMDRLIISQPDCAEQALSVVETLCQSGLVDLVVVDSVAAFVTRAELEGDMGSSHMAGNARLLSQACRKLKGVVHKTNTALVFVNQIRMKIGVMFGSPETTTGGKALKYYSTIRIDIRRIASVKDGSDNIGNVVRTKIVKNKVAPPFKQAEFEILFGKGVNKTGCILDAGADYKLIDKKGSHFSYNNLKLGNGKANACKTLSENPEVMDEIRNKVLEKLEALKTPKSDEGEDTIKEE